MTKDEIQFWMFIAFAVAFLFSSYKVYIIFSTPVEGIDSNTQHLQLENIIISFLSHTHEGDLTEKTLFQNLKELESLQEDSFKNFNQNRLNQLLKKLYITYEVDSLNELIIGIKNAT